MKQVLIDGPYSTKILDVDKPKALKDWVVVKIRSAPLCTEFKFFKDGVMPDYPLGHEASGEVVEILDESNLKNGDRVVVMPQYPCGNCYLCDSGEYIHCLNTFDIKSFTGIQYGASTLAEYIVKPSWLLPKIPDELTYDEASMICCGLGPTYGAIDRIDLKKEDTVLITGMGPVGLGGIINAKDIGAKVIVTGHNDYRNDLAKKLGADLIINPKKNNALKLIKEFTNGLGVNKSIDCAGSVDSQRLCINVSKRNASIAFVGESNSLKVHISNDLIRNGLTMVGVWHYNHNLIDDLMKISIRNKEKLNSLITHKFEIENINEAFLLQMTRKCGKVIISP